MEYDKDQEIEELQVEDSYSEEELQGVLKSEMDDAKDFIDQIDMRVGRLAADIL